MAASKPATWLFVSGTAAFGGHEVMMLRLMDELRRQGRVECHLLGRTGGRLHARASGPCFHALGSAADSRPRALGRLHRLLTVSRDITTLWRTLRAVKPSLCVTVEGAVCTLPIHALVARLTGVRVAIYTPLIDGAAAMNYRLGWFRDWLTRAYANLPHAWITITRQQAEKFAEWAGVTRPIFTLSNAVTRDVEQAGAAAESISDRVGRADVCDVLVLGRLDMNQKGLDLLLGFLERTPSLQAKFRVHVVGEGSGSDEIRRRLADSSLLASVVTLQPWSTGAIDLMRKHDVLLIPSRFEGVPLVMLEAMALGLPVVASDLPGTRAYLSPECLFPVGDLARAFEIVAGLRDGQARTEALRRNRSVFESSASEGAFESAVAVLTNQLIDLSPRPDAQQFPARGKAKRVANAGDAGHT